LGEYWIKFQGFNAIVEQIEGVMNETFEVLMLFLIFLYKKK